MAKINRSVMQEVDEQYQSAFSAIADADFAENLAKIGIRASGMNKDSSDFGVVDALKRIAKTREVYPKESREYEEALAMKVGKSVQTMQEDERETYPKFTIKSLHFLDQIITAYGKDGESVPNVLRDVYARAGMFSRKAKTR